MATIVSRKSPEWEALTAQRRGAQTLRENPGQWIYMGQYGYRGGFSQYTKRGFKKAIRQVEPGVWDIYLMWPEITGD